MFVAPSVASLKPPVGCQITVRPEPRQVVEAPLKVGKPIGGVEEVATVTTGVLVVGAW